MGDKISKNIIVVIVSFISAIVGIFAFATGKNFPDFFDSSSYSNDLSTEKVEEHSSSQNWPNSMENDIDFDFIKGDDSTITQNTPGEDHTAQQTDNYELTRSAVHFPNVLSGGYTCITIHVGPSRISLVLPLCKSSQLAGFWVYSRQ